MSLLAALSVAAGILIQTQINRRWVQQNTERVFMGIILLAALNSAAHFYVLQDIKQTTNFIFVLAVSGYLLPNAGRFYFIVVVQLLIWSALVYLGPGLSGDAVHFGFALALGLMFSVFLHTVRRNQLQQFDDLQKAVDEVSLGKQQISAGEIFLKNLMDNIPVGIVVRDEATRILFSNAAAADILGQDTEDVQGKVAGEGFELCDSKGLPLPRDQLPTVRVLATGDRIVNEQASIRTVSGELRSGLLNAYLVESDGNSGRFVVSSFLDITSRIQVENQLKDSEQSANSILDSVFEGILTIDLKSRITRFNPAAEVLTGFTESEALGRPLTEIVQFVDDEMAPHSEDARAEAMVRRGRLTSRDGRETEVERVTSKISREGKTMGEVVTLRDLGDQLLIEQERAMLDKMRSVGLLAGGIAHDFNNLLTSIYGNLSMAESAIDDRTKALKYLQRSSASIEHATNLTNQLLTFARGSDPVMEVVDAESLVREVAGFVLSGSSIGVSFDISADLAPIEVDAGQMQQALSNIVLNAKQAMSDSGQIRIELRNVTVGQRPAEYVELAIEDDGPGMAPEVLAKIFDPYYTTKEAGTGLGLATTHSIVTKHGGTISVDSAPGTGTSITLTLPAGKWIEESEQRGVERPKLSASSLNILVMDDEKMVLETVIDLLESLGHSATGTHHGEEAIEAYAKAMNQGERYDLVIMDLRVTGGMGGSEAAGKLLALDPEARLIVSSGYSEGSEMARYQELGFEARLEKPFSLDELEALILGLTSRSG